MFCARCNKPIYIDEDYDTVDHHAASGPGTTVYVHTKWCGRAPQQTCPTRPPERHRPRRRR